MGHVALAAHARRTRIESLAPPPIDAQFSADWSTIGYAVVFTGKACMPPILLAASLALAAAPPAHADDFSDVCHASSSFDLTVTANALAFDREQPAPRRVQLHDGKISIDGAALQLGAEQTDRAMVFEQELRALVPKAKAVAADGVDLALKSVRAEAAQLGLSARTSAELDAVLARHAAELKRRVAASTSTHDWQGDAFQRDVENAVAEIAPLVASDLGAQAIAAALDGDLDTAAQLREHGERLQTDLRPRLVKRMQALRPEVQALCPSIRRLYELQRGLRGADGRALDLLDVGR